MTSLIQISKKKKKKTRQDNKQNKITLFISPEIATDLVEILARI